MLRPTSLGTSDATGTIRSRLELELASPHISEKRSKARVRCTWKGCDYRESNIDEMK